MKTIVLTSFKDASGISKDSADFPLKMILETHPFFRGIVYNFGMKSNIKSWIPNTPSYYYFYLDFKKKTTKFKRDMKRFKHKQDI